MNADVKKYFDAVPDARRERVDALHRTVLGLYPRARVDLQYRMPTYHHGEGWVALANQKNYVSLYTCGAHHLEKFRAAHPEIKTGKGCINFRDRDELPVAAIESVIRHAIEHPKPR